MKGQHDTAVEKLHHALIFVRAAKVTKFPELLKQHLDEVERLVEYALGILEEPHGEAPQG